MTPTEKLKATMAALGISAQGLKIGGSDRVLTVSDPYWVLYLNPDRLLFRAIQIGRMFGRERCS